MKKNPDAPFHRRTLDETCRVCDSPPGVDCADMRSRPDNLAWVGTKHPHRYQPETAPGKVP